MSEARPSVEERVPAAARRTLLGKSAILWSSHGEHRVEPAWWKAMSGVRSVDYNVLVCHGSDLDLVRQGLDAVAAANCPAMIMLAGPALAGAQILGDAGWVCIGVSPIMALQPASKAGLEIDSSVCEAGPGDLPGVWEAIRETFGLSDSLARVAIPEDVFNLHGCTVWVLAVDGEVRSCVATVIVDRALMVWSMATRPSWQHHGYGRRLLTTALARGARDGVTESILSASPAGEPLYRSLGYEVTEYWQLWSRPRWVFGRS